MTVHNNKCNYVFSTFPAATATVSKIIFTILYYLCRFGPLLFLAVL